MEKGSRVKLQDGRMGTVISDLVFQIWVDIDGSGLEIISPKKVSTV